MKSNFMNIYNIVCYVECNDNASGIFGGHLNAGAEETIVVIIRWNDAGAWPYIYIYINQDLIN